MVPKSKPARKQGSGASAKTVPCSVRINSDHLERAQQLAKRKGVTVAAIVQMALAEKLDREEKES